MTASRAVLNGMASPNGLPSVAWFEWDNGSRIFTRSTESTQVGSGYAVVRVSAALTNLVDGGAYHCRLVTSNSAGLAYGPEVRFTTGGQIIVWGSNNFGQLNIPAGVDDVLGVSAGAFHSMALMRGGRVSVWGNSVYGQAQVPEDLTNAVAIQTGGSAGWYCTALRSDSTITGWGIEGYLQTPPPGLTGVIALAGGATHTMALHADGHVTAWGNNASGQTNVPPNLTNVVDIAGGGYFSMALRDDGSVVAWGANEHGQVDGATDLRDVVAIAGGEFHGMALHRNGTVSAWGLNDYGQAKVPENLSDVVSIAAGGEHSMALMRDGTVRVWGSQLPREGLDSVVIIAGGGWHCLAVRSMEGLVSPPLVATLTFHRRAATAVQLHGAVTSNGAETSAWFEWGETLPYASIAPVPGTFSGLQSAAVSVLIEGLAAGVPYHYRCVASNMQGVAYGPDRLFIPGTPGSDARLASLTLSDGALEPAFDPAAVVYYVGLPSSSSSIHILPVALDTNATVLVTAPGQQPVAVPPGSPGVDCALAGGTNSIAITVVSEDGLVTLNYRVDVFRSPPAPPSVEVQPADVPALAGHPARFEVTAAGFPPLTFQWQRGEAAIAGAVDAVLRFPNPQFADEGDYRVIIANAVGAITSRVARLTVAASPPEITLQPASQVVLAGADVVFAAAAIGTEPMGYQWRFQGTNIEAATNATLVLRAVQDEAVGAYSVLVSNSEGSTNSAFATLELAPEIPTLTEWPVNQTVYDGARVVLSAAARGTKPLSYQWQFNGNDLPGATGDTLELPVVGFDHAGLYRVVVTNRLGGATSPNARLTVLDRRPVITQHPTNLTTSLLGTAVFKGAATGAGTLRYQWRLNGMNLTNGGVFAGVTTPILTVTSVVPAIAGPYSLVVTNTYGAAKSSNAATVLNFIAAWGAGTTTNMAGDYWRQSIVPPGLTNAVAVAAGDYHTLALREDGTVVAWGAGTTNRNIHPEYGQSSVPTNLSDVISVAAGGVHSLALRRDGLVVAWGAGTNRALSTSPHYRQSIVPTNLTGVKAISAGLFHNLALKADGTVVAWGYNGNRQTNVPPGLSNVIAIAAGSYHSMALRADGTVVSWGSTTNTAGVSNIVAIAAGTELSLALRENGTVTNWGAGIQQLTLANNRDIVAIAAGGTHGLALRTNGVMYSWGDRVYNMDITPPGLLPISVAAGFRHNVALLGDGAIRLYKSPPSRLAYVGESATFTVTVMAAQPLGYRWQWNGTDIVRGTNTFLTLMNLQYTNAGSYRVILNNAMGSVTSAPAVLTIQTRVTTTNLASLFQTAGAGFVWSTEGAAPWFGETNVFHSAPTAAQSGMVGEGQESVLSASVVGPGLIRFWWRVSSEEWFDSLSFHIGDTRMASLSGSPLWQLGSFHIPPGTNLLRWVYAKDATVSRGADAGWLDDVSFLPGVVVFTQHPSGSTLVMGGTYTLVCQASAPTPPGYQWLRNGTAIPGANETSLTLTNVGRRDAGVYSVVASAGAESVLSREALVEVPVSQRLSAAVPRAGEAFTLLSIDEDGGLLVEGDLSRMEIQSSPNLQEWTTLTNGITVTNGRIHVTEADFGVRPARFFRIIER